MEGATSKSKKPAVFNLLKLQMSTVRSRDVSPLHPSKIGCSFSSLWSIQGSCLNWGPCHVPFLPVPSPCYCLCSSEQETSATFIKSLEKIRSLTSESRNRFSKSFKYLKRQECFEKTPKCPVQQHPAETYTPALGSGRHLSTAWCCLGS